MNENEFAIQRDNSTELNRHPTIFEMVKRLCAVKGIEKPRILSFGCSKGDEPYTLGTKYFTDSEIVALDVSDEILEIAKRDRGLPGIITYDKSTRESLFDHGPYDVIFAMSVLCRWPSLANAANANHLFSFYQYEAMIKLLHAVLNVAGVLSIYNSNYALSDSDLINCYSIVLDPRLRENGYVKHFDSTGRSIDNYAGTETIYLKEREQVDVANCSNLSFINADGVPLGIVRTTRFRAII